MTVIDDQYHRILLNVSEKYFGGSENALLYLMCLVQKHGKTRGYSEFYYELRARMDKRTKDTYALAVAASFVDDAKLKSVFKEP